MDRMCGRFSLRARLQALGVTERTDIVEERLEALEHRLKRRTFIELAVFVLAAVVLSLNLASVDYSLDNISAPPTPPR